MTSKMVRDADGSGGRHAVPCGCDCAERLEAVTSAGALMRFWLGENSLPPHVSAMTLGEVLVQWDIAEHRVNPPPPASTAPDQGQDDSCGRLTSAIMTDAAKVLKDCQDQMEALDVSDSVLSGWIDSSIEALTERSASLGGAKFDALNADEDRMVELEGALEFYADNDNWERFSDGGGGHMPSDAMIDEGEVARRALEVKP